MINPLDILLNPVTLFVLALYFILIIIEETAPARKLPHVKYWRLRGITMFLLYLALSSYLPLFWDKHLAAYQLLDLTHLSTLQGALCGILLYEFGVYMWHRLMHRSDFLWRVFHQMHHSAERLDTYGAFYFSPMDILGWTMLGSLCFSLIIGLSPAAISITLLFTNFLSIFQHANIRTAKWLGYIVQRPESHSIHHSRGVHAFNYSDLPIFDIIFGTYKNPETFAEETGFYDGASAKVKEMVLFKDISTACDPIR